MEIYENYFIFTCLNCGEKKTINYSDIRIGYASENWKLYDIAYIGDCDICKAIMHIRAIPKPLTIANLGAVEIFLRATNAGCSYVEGITKEDVENYFANSKRLTDYFSLPQVVSEYSHYIYIPLAKLYYDDSFMRQLLFAGGKLYGTVEEKNQYLDILLAGVDAKLRNQIKANNGI